MSTDKSTFINLVIDSINKDNREISRNVGMEDDEIEKSIAQSQASLVYMANNLYDTLVKNKIIQN